MSKTIIIDSYYEIHLINDKLNSSYYFALIFSKIALKTEDSVSAIAGFLIAVK